MKIDPPILVNADLKTLALQVFVIGVKVLPVQVVIEGFYYKRIAELDGIGEIKNDN